jgi:hypothetical protein
MFDVPLTFKDEHVNELFIVVVPLTFKDDEHVVVLLNVVDPETLNDEKHVVILLIMVIPDTYNDVFIEIPPVFNLIVSHVPLLVFNIMLCIEGDAMVKSPTRL